MIRFKDRMAITRDALRGKKILVVGLGRSGRGAANILSSLGSIVSVTDMKPLSSLKDEAGKLSPDITIRAGGNPQNLFLTCDLIILSPGVPLTIPQIALAREKGIPVMGELELAYQLVATERQNFLKSGEGEAVPLIGITGTNGKSTTATLVDLMLRRSGYRTLLCGNIGRAMTEEIQALGYVDGEPEFSKVDYFVAEISSFQLESVLEFRPRLSAILNISPDHLDRYHNLEEYIQAKARIFENQGEGDSLILNSEDVRVMKMYGTRCLQSGSMPDIFYFSRCRVIEGIYLKDGIIYCNLPDIPSIPLHSPVISADEMKIKGIHNLENAMAASLLAILSGCGLQDVREALMDFPGLEHRMEFTGEIGEIRFINDSKGTNTGAVMRSLESFEQLILIMGGVDKGEDFTLLRDLISRKVKVLVLLGEAKEKIAREAGDVTETIFAGDMTEAVRVAVSRASDGDVIMLSPGCASFDMFDDFEDRGRNFKDAVRKITDEYKKRT
jgi:UDP-N-acetylmuramoylalanine--D-glutamate ligase